MTGSLMEDYDGLISAAYYGDPCEAVLDTGACGRPAKAIRLGNLLGGVPHIHRRPVCGIHKRALTVHIPFNYDPAIHSKKCSLCKAGVR